MDTQDNARSGSVFEQHLRNADVQRSEFAEANLQCSLVKFCPEHTRTKTFNRLVKAITRGDRSAADKILRRWRIRR